MLNQNAGIVQNDEHIEVTPVKKHYIINENNDSRYDNSLIFGYGNTNVDEIEIGIKKLKKIL